MEKIKTFENELDEQVISYYQFSKELSFDNIYLIVDTLDSSGIELSQIRLSNSDDSPEHFFRLFPTLRDFRMFSFVGDANIDDFGVRCAYNGIKFSLTFDLDKSQVVTFVRTNDNINLEPLLIQIEQMCQKKTR